MMVAVLKSRYGCHFWADTAKFTDMIVARFRNCRDLVREGKVFVKNKAEVPSGVGCSERGVMNFRKMLFKSNSFFLFFIYGLLSELNMDE